jgi:hypothetical protein
METIEGEKIPTLQLKVIEEEGKPKSVPNKS